jgi:hypothetical protein
MVGERTGHLPVLREDEHPFLTRGDRFAQLTEPFELAAVARFVGGIAEPLGRVIADPFDPREEGEDDPAPLDAFDLGPIEAFGQFLDRLLVQDGLVEINPARGRIRASEFEDP